MEAIEYPQVSECRITTRIVYSSIGVLIGLSIFIVFSFHYQNYDAGAWGLCSGTAAAIALGVTIAFKKQVWAPIPHKLKIFMLTGCFIQLAGVAGFVAYLTLAISQGQGLVIYHRGYYLTCVWCFMTWKWGFLLLLYSRSFLRSYIKDTGRILQNEEVIGKKSFYNSINEEN